MPRRLCSSGPGHLPEVGEVLCLRFRRPAAHQRCCGDGMRSPGASLIHEEDLQGQVHNECALFVKHSPANAVAVVEIHTLRNERSQTVSLPNTQGPAHAWNSSFRQKHAEEKFAGTCAP